MAVAFSTYSKIPMPQFEWKEENMRYSMCFFPLIGAAIGAMLILSDFFMRICGCKSPFRAAVSTVLPLIITGGIHMDGYMDTTDALRSYKGKEERLNILKDPHVGAFAVIHAAILLTLIYGFYTEAKTTDLYPIAFSFVISRCLSGLAVVIFPKAKKDGMLHAVSDAAKHAEKRIRNILILELAASAFFMAVASLCAGGETVSGICRVCLMLAAAGLTFAYYHNTACEKFGGTTGDLAGWFLCVC